MGETALSLAHERNLALEARTVRYIQETASPETCSGLAWTKPPRAQDYVIIWKFGLAPEKRPDRAKAPCPICSPAAPKYYSGALAWFPYEGVYRAIGNECARHAIGYEHAERAEREYRERQSHDSDYEFAYANIRAVPAILGHFEALLPVVVEAERNVRLVGQSQVRKLVYHAAKGRDGRLMLWETPPRQESDDLEPDEKPEPARPIPINMGAVRGYECLGPNYHVAAELREQITRFQPLDYGDGDEALEWILDHYEARRDLAVFRKLVVKAKEAHRRAHLYMGVVRAFFTPENFGVLETYGKDRRNPHPFYAIHRNGEYRIGLSRIDARTIRPNFSTIDALPSWPDFTDPRDAK